MRVSIKSVRKYVTTIKFKQYFGIWMKTDENGLLLFWIFCFHLSEDVVIVPACLDRAVFPSTVTNEHKCSSTRYAGSLNVGRHLFRANVILYFPSFLRLFCGYHKFLYCFILPGLVVVPWKPSNLLTMYEQIVHISLITTLVNIFSEEHQ